MAYHQRPGPFNPVVEKTDLRACSEMKYEKWSAGYWLLKQYVRFADWFILKKTIVTGKKNIPLNKPVIFSPNHQNALSDPMAVLLNTRYQPVWLGRADIFSKSKIIDSILRFMKIVPVYRLRDGKENLEKNGYTFEVSVKVLENNFALALFPEAAHSGKRQMLIHKKAVPRIAFMAEEKSDRHLDIQIIPAGIYYSHYWKFNRSVIINFGEPIRVSDYLELYSQNPTAAAMAMKANIYKAMLPLVINIASTKYYEGFENIREIYGRHYMKRQHKAFSTLTLFKSDQYLVRQLDELEKNHPEKTELLVQDAADYSGEVKKLGLRSWLLDSSQIHLPIIIGNLILLIAGLPLFLYGFIFNAIPFFLVDRVVRKKVKDKSFWSTFFLVAGIVVFPLFYLLELVAVVWYIPGFWLNMAFLVSLPFAGKIAFNWYILLRKTTGRLRLMQLKWFRGKIYRRLMKQREQLYQNLDTLIEVV
jgi:1-acyl-sn-glycerol-3-phosphate acyltransferase